MVLHLKDKYYEEESKQFLQFRVKDKKCYIAKLSLISGTDPYVLPNRPRSSVASITEVSDIRVASCT